MPIRAVLFDMYETLCTHYRSPLYFGAQIAEELGVPPEVFLPLWRNAAREEARTLGKLTLADQLRCILPQCGMTAPDRMESLVVHVQKRRSQWKRQCLHTLHPEILPLLWQLKARKLKLAVISNCYDEEAQVIRAWAEGRCFDALLLSCEQGVKKPDAEIYRRCMAQLGVEAQECLFVGDGGSHELEAAAQLGMTAVQAAWYIAGVPDHPSPVRQDVPSLLSPMDVLSILL